MTQETYIARFWKQATLVAAAVCVSASAFAAEPWPNGGELKANVEYTLGAATPQTAVFYPTADGTVLYNNYVVIRPHMDKDLVEEMSSQFLNYNDGGTASLEVRKGVPVYFGPNWTGYYATGSNFMISMNQPIEVTGYSTRPGGILSLTSGFNTLDIYFNQPVHAGTVEIKIDGTNTSRAISMGTANMTTMAIPYLSVLQNWFNTGALQGGEDLTLTIGGIVNSEGKKYKDGADLVLNYKAPAKTTTIREVNFPDPFMSYWRKGDPNAVATITYSGTISKAGYVMTFGNFEAEIPDGYLEEGYSYAQGKAPVTVEGNTVKIDFSGVQRRPKDMVPSGTNYENLVVKVYAWDQNGEPVAGESQGQVGSFDRLLNYNYISPAELNASFTPENGKSLKGEDNIEIHLYDYSKIDFTGVKFEIEGGQTITVPKAQITEKAGNNFDHTLTIPVPAAAKTTDSKVTVTLEGLTSTDGVDHSNDIRAVYNGFTITTFELYDPNNQLITARTLSEIPADSKVSVVPNVIDTYPDLYMEYMITDIYNGETSIVKTNVWLNKEEDKWGDVVYTQYVPQTIKMVRGHEYRFVFTAWPSEQEKYSGAEPLGEEYYVYEGSSEPFRFSSIQLVSVDPANETEIEPTQTQFTLVYDGLVQITTESSFINYGQGMTVPFASLTPVVDEDGEEGYANTWIITIPDTYIATYGVETLNLTIVATDIDGRLVEGNLGEEEGSFLYLTYPIAGAGLNDDFYVNPSEGIVESLYEFEIGCLGQSISLNFNAEEQIILFDRNNRVELYHFGFNDLQAVYTLKDGITSVPEGTVEGDEAYYDTKYVFQTPVAVQDEGVYTLSIPEGFFIFGSQLSTTRNAARTVVYEIEAEPGLPDYSVVPSEGTVNELETIVITFPDGASIGAGAPNLTIDDNDPIKLNDPMMEFPDDFNDPTTWFTLTLPEKYTANGTYVITFPRGYFQNIGGDLPMIELTYVIGTTGIDMVFGDAESIDVYTVDGRNLVKNGTTDDVKALAPGFYIINGKKVILK